MHFCYSPWSNIDIDPAGKMAPCCKFQKQYYSQVYNIQKDSIHDYMDSQMLADVKADFSQGRWPAGCERCRIEEENNISSKRQLDQERWQKEYSFFDITQSKFITASIAFGNTCNLKCITCNSYSSSRWQKEYREIYAVDHPHVQFYKQNFLQKFTELAPGLIHLDIPGGEPFLSGIKEQLQLLQHYVDNGRAHEITLHYTTNANVFPDDRWWQLWRHFKEIDLQISVDGIGQRYEYIRFPGQWSVLVENVGKYLQKQNQNFRLSVSHTVSAYNVYYLDEFFAWCTSQSLPRPWLCRLHRPNHLRPSVWPETARAVIHDKLCTSQYLDVKNWADLVLHNDDSQYYDQFCNLTKLHDQYRNLEFNKTFPELANYLK